jgi:iron complex outermembrane receptor protein
MKAYLLSTSIVATCLFAIPVAKAQTAPEDPAATEPASDIIVTGTRQTGITAAESAAPIKLVNQEMMSHVGQPNLNQVLTQLVPSFRAQSFGADAANLTLSSSLRGLNPNHTLVLVNGKRRHGTANLQVQAGFAQGGAAPDLDYIPPASVDHIEVLEDGAAAQYGSDAVAGVINIILKKKAGGALSATGGQNYTRGGETYSGSLNYGVTDDRGYLNFTLFYRHNEATRQGDQDLRAQWFDGVDPPFLYGALLTDTKGAENYPYVTPALGRAQSRFGVGSFNAGYDLTDAVELYGFGSIGYRNADSSAYYRPPNRVVATADGVDRGGVSTDDYNAIVSTDPSRIFSRNGFVPRLTFREIDSSIAGGVRGDVGGWRWDLSTTYGEDRVKAYTRNSANAVLFAEQRSKQRDFYDGSFSASEWTSNIDISRDFGTLATLAVGGEYRENRYTITSGETASYYKTGAQSFPGFSPTSAGHRSRHNVALYGDIALTPVEGLKLDGAVRYEDYSDFGSTTNWKITGRYDFSPAVAIRGTASTGFRAPTLAEQYYTQVGVSPTAAIVQLAANSAAAKVLGIADLGPEKSTSFSAGLVLRPAPRLTVTLDAYQIKLRDRIVGTATVIAKSAGVSPSDLIWQAITASGFGVETVPFVGVSSFINGPTTRTRGVDLTGSYAADLGGAGRATFTVSGAYTNTKIRKASVTPAALQAYGASIADAQSDSSLTTVTPKFKVIGGINWNIGASSINARETFYSKSVGVLNDGGGLNRTQIDAAGITDLEVGYKITPKITLSVGAQNLFDKKPERVELVPGRLLSDGGAIVNAPYVYGAYGIDGGYWYGRLDISF